MQKPHTLAELKSALAKVEIKLKTFNELSMERIRLSELIKAWETVFPTESEKGQSVAKVGAPIEPGSTAAFAYHSLNEFGAMAAGPLLVSVRQKGWKGTGDDRKDRDRLYSVMKRRPDKFARTSDGKWKAIKPPDQP